ncbi:EthD family reductase [Pacificimonas sp. ICDLI1SI03]
MTKTIAFMPRRPGSTRSEFRTHYETRHAPMAMPLFPFSRYRRNHLPEDAGEPGFDCISEFWVSSLEEIGELMAGDAGATMREDERRFLDQERTRAGVSESVLTDGDAGDTILLLADDGGDRSALKNACRTVGASLEFLTSLSDQALPYDAMIRLSGEQPSLPDGWKKGPCLKIMPSETPPDQLRGGAA